MTVKIFIKIHRHGQNGLVGLMRKCSVSSFLHTVNGWALDVELLSISWSLKAYPHNYEIKANLISV